MATTAKQSASEVRGAANFQESEEDIATIAKQISDHAEAIYQTWKARGLGPTEILNCHADADNTFNQTLSPKSPTANISPELLAKAPDLSNQNLKHLVSSFVNEDKARIAAQKGDPAGPPASPSSVSSIKYALQKFEKKSQNQESSPIAAFLNSPSVYTSNKCVYLFIFC